MTLQIALKSKVGRQRYAGLIQNEQNQSYSGRRNDSDDASV